MKSTVKAIVSLSQNEYAVLLQAQKLITDICESFTDECSSDCPFFSTCRHSLGVSDCGVVNIDELIEKIVKAVAKDINEIEVQVS